MSREQSQGEGPCAPSKTLRVLRVDADQQFTVRFLSKSYLGLLVHWYKGRSIPCPGKKCFSDLHRLPLFWKGYAPTVVWQPASKNWLPTVLEITEHLELDLRGQDLRGQEWLLERAEQAGKKKTPVRGTFRQTVPADQVPAWFDPRPCLYHLYHCKDLLLDAKNPLPPRVQIAPVEGSEPLADTTAPPQRLRLDPEQSAAFRRRVGLPPKPNEAAGADAGANGKVNGSPQR